MNSCGDFLTSCEENAKENESNVLSYSSPIVKSKPNSPNSSPKLISTNLDPLATASINASVFESTCASFLTSSTTQFTTAPSFDSSNNISTAVFCPTSAGSDTTIINTTAVYGRENDVYGAETTSLGPSNNEKKIEKSSVDESPQNDQCDPQAYCELQSESDQVYNDVRRNWNATLSDMFHDEGGGDGPACVESDDDLSDRTPPAAHWAKSLRHLLEDEVGHNVFRAFVEREVGSAHSLYFWYACRGLHQGEYDGDMEGPIEVIWKHFIKKKNVEVSGKIYKDIELRIKAKDFDRNIFDEAQKEIEDKMNMTIYRAFLESDDYLQCLIPNKKGELDSLICYPDCLPTLHEDTEFVSSVQNAKHYQQPAALTFNNLIATASQRINMDKTKPEAHAGMYLRNSLSAIPNPYHVNYISGHSVSLMDSEVHSMSSGAYTDDSRSFTDSSMDRSSYLHTGNRRELRRLNQRIRASAQLNKEPPDLSALSKIHVLPRTMLPGHQDKCSNLAAENQKEFARLVCEKLENYRHDQDRKIRLRQSMLRVTQGDEAPDEARREHAVSALPPEVLADRLKEEKIHLGELDPSQSILDEHVARVWDSPSSPQQDIVGRSSTPPICDSGQSQSQKINKTILTKQLPHLSYPQNAQSVFQNAFSKNSSKSGRFATAAFQSSSSQPMWGHSNPFSDRARHSSGCTNSSSYTFQPNFGNVSSQSNHNFGLNQSSICGKYPLYHGRRKDKRLDVNSTFSSDSGNVPDCSDGRLEHLQHLSKSKSMPEYMEEHAGWHGLLTGSAEPIRRHCRNRQPDFTDSGVSVISDSGRSGAPSTTSERVESWLYCNRPFSCDVDDSSSTMYPDTMSGNECRLSSSKGIPSHQRTKANNRSRTLTDIGTASPSLFRRGVILESNRCRSQSSSSTSANTCINTHIDAKELDCPALHSVPLPEFSVGRDTPLGQAQPTVTSDRKFKNPCDDAFDQQNSAKMDETMISSSLKKHPLPSKLYVPDVPATGSVSSSVVQPATSSTPSASDITTIVYTFQDDNVPFVIRVPSRPVTLKKFKAHLHKKGSFRYFFKKFCEEMGTVFEEIVDDVEILPFYEGKVFVQIHKD